MDDVWVTSEPLPTPIKVTDKVVAALINESNRSVGPGPGGCSMTAIQQFIRHPVVGQRVLTAITELANACFRGELTREATRLFNISTLTPLHKESLAAREASAAEARARGEAAVPAARPIGVLTVLRRLIAKLFNDHEEIADPIRKHIGVTQLGVGIRAGAETAVHAVRATLRARKAAGRPTLLVCLDASDAYNRAVRRLAALKFAEVAPGGLPFIVMINGGSNFMVWDSEVFEMGEGVIQGDSISPTEYALIIHGLGEKVRDYARSKGWSVLIFLFLDDFFILGDPEHAYELVLRIREWGPEFGYHLNGKKSQFCLTAPEGTAMTAEDAAMHCSYLTDIGGPGGPVGAPVADGVPHLKGAAIVLGAPVGDPRETFPILRQKVEEAAASVRELQNLTNKQLALSLLIETRNSCLVNFLLRAVPADEFIDPATGRSILGVFDAAIDGALSRLLATDEDRDAAGEPIQISETASARAQLPRGRKGGLGLRHAGPLSTAAYAAGLNDVFDAAMTLLQQDGFMSEEEARQALEVTTAESWVAYDAFVQGVPSYPHDDIDEEGERIPPILRDCLTRPYVHPRHVKLTNLHRQKSLTIRVDRRVQRGAALTVRVKGAPPHEQRIASLDSRYMRAVPGRPGAIVLTDTEIAASLQHALGVETDYALRGVVTNACGTLGPPSVHSVSGCSNRTVLPSSWVMDRHNHTNNHIVTHARETGIHGAMSSHHSKSIKIPWVVKGQAVILEPADIAVADMAGTHGRTAALDVTFVDTLCADHRDETVAEALKKRRAFKLDKYAAACAAHGLAFRPLVFTAGGRASMDTAIHLAELFGLRVWEYDSKTSGKLINHVFLGLGRCPRGLAPVMYERILHLKRALSAISGVCARSTARALIAHSHYKTAFMTPELVALWERAMQG
jgi:hypothetical protein